MSSELKQTDTIDFGHGLKVSLWYVGASKRTYAIYRNGQGLAMLNHDMLGEALENPRTVFLEVYENGDYHHHTEPFKVIPV